MAENQRADPGGAPTGPPTRARLRVVPLLFVAVVVNYLDRSNLSIAAPLLAQDFGLTPGELGYVFSAFGWTYAFLQIPAGWLVDRVAPRLLYAVSLVGWSFATMLLGAASGLAGLIGLRLVLGALEAPAFPINSKVVTAWFPERERAKVIGLYTSGQFVGLAFLTPILVWIQSGWGWRGMFAATGAAGILWGLVWYGLYRDPAEARAANAAEIDLIRRGGGLATRERPARARPFSWADFRFVLSSRKLWGLFIGQFCLTSSTWFFLTWFPTYLVRYRHMDFLKAGFAASAPFLAAVAGVIASGWLSDRMLARGASLGTARKTPVITGLLLSTTILGANFVSSDGAAIACMTLAFFGHGFAAITWSLVSAMAPRELIGLTGGVFNLMGNLSAVTVPIAIGHLVTGEDFAPAIVLVALLAVIGAASYLVLVGRVERLVFRPATPDGSAAAPG